MELVTLLKELQIFVQEERVHPWVLCCFSILLFSTEFTGQESIIVQAQHKRGVSVLKLWEILFIFLKSQNTFLVLPKTDMPNTMLCTVQ